MEGCFGQPAHSDVRRHWRANCRRPDHGLRQYTYQSLSQPGKDAFHRVPISQLIMKKLLQVLRQADKSSSLFTSPDGTRVLVLAHGGRVLGLFSPGSEENFYWTHTALESAASAQEFY